MVIGQDLKTQDSRSLNVRLLSSIWYLLILDSRDATRILGISHTQIFTLSYLEQTAGSET